MKKLLFTICVVALVSNSILAQSKIRFGVNGGMTYSSFRGNKAAEELDAGFDFLVGVSVEYPLKNKLSLLANLSYDSKTASSSIILVSALAKYPSS